jgi:deoxyribose-phosphate aldolase
VRRGVAAHLDATLLKPEATEAQILELCDRASAVNAAAVCVNPVWVRVAVHALRGRAPAVAAVVDFPLGAGTTASRRTQARRALLDGARELDLVASLALIRAGLWRELFEDLWLVIATGRPAQTKVILETAALSEREIVLAALIAREAGAGWVKTSTGFHHAGGATATAVGLLRTAVGDRMGVKASGGIRSLADAALMLAAGADRIGASAIEALKTDLTLGELLI